MLERKYRESQREEHHALKDGTNGEEDSRESGEARRIRKTSLRRSGQWQELTRQRE